MTNALDDFEVVTPPANAASDFEVVADPRAQDATNPYHPAYAGPADPADPFTQPARTGAGQYLKMLGYQKLANGPDLAEGDAGLEQAAAQNNTARRDLQMGVLQEVYRRGGWDEAGKDPALSKLAFDLLNDPQGNQLKYKAAREMSAEGNSAVGNFSRAGVNAMGNVGLNVVGTVAPEAANALGAKMESTYNPDMNRFSGKAGGLTGNVVGTLPLILTGTAAPGFAMQGAGQGRREVANLREQGHAISGGQAALYATTSGVIQGALGHVLGNAAGGAEIPMQSILSRLSPELVAAAKGTDGAVLRPIIQRAMLNFGAGATTNQVLMISQEVARKLEGINPDDWAKVYEQIVKNTPQTLAEGGAMGVGFGAVGEVNRPRYTPQNPNATPATSSSEPSGGVSVRREPPTPVLETPGRYDNPTPSETSQWGGYPEEQPPFTQGVSDVQAPADRPTPGTGMESAVSRGALQEPQTPELQGAEKLGAGVKPQLTSDEAHSLRVLRAIKADDPSAFGEDQQAYLDVLEAKAGTPAPLNPAKMHPDFEVVTLPPETKNERPNEQTQPTPEPARAEIRSLPPQGGGRSGEPSPGESVDGTPDRASPSAAQRPGLVQALRTAAKKYRGVSVEDDGTDIHFVMPDKTRVRHVLADRMEPQPHELDAYLQSAKSENDGAAWFEHNGRDVKIPANDTGWGKLSDADRTAILDTFRIHGAYDHRGGTITTTNRVIGDHTIAGEEIFHAQAARLKAADPDVYNRMINRYDNEDAAFRKFQGKATREEFFKRIRQGKAHEAPPEKPLSPRQEAENLLVQQAKEDGVLMPDHEFEQFQNDQAGLHPDHLEAYTPAQQARLRPFVNEGAWSNLVDEVGTDRAEMMASRMADEILSNKADKIRRAAEHYLNDESAHPELRQAAAKVLGEADPTAEALPEGDIPFAVRRIETEGHNNQDVHALVNPTADELKAYRANRAMGEVRGIRDPETGDTYFWPSWALTHKYASEKLGVSWDKIVERGMYENRFIYGSDGAIDQAFSKDGNPGLNGAIKRPSKTSGPINTDLLGNRVGAKDVGGGNGVRTGKLFGDMRKGPASAIEDTRTPDVPDKQQGRLFGVRKKTAEDSERDLVALHNLTSDHIKGADKLGGIPLPSIAITRTGIPFSQYGDVTLVGDRKMVDPANRENHVHDADMYSQRMPPQKFKIKTKAVNALTETLSNDPTFKKYSKVGDYNASAHYIHDWMDDHGGIDNAISTARRSAPFMAKYLAEQGVEPAEIPMMRKRADANGRFNQLAEMPEFAEVAKKLSPVIDDYHAGNISSDQLDALMPQLHEHLRPAAEARAKQMADTESTPEDRAAMHKDWMDGFDKALDQSNFWDIERALKYHESYAKNETVRDDYALQDALEKQITEHGGKAPFDAWLGKTFETARGDAYFENQRGTKKPWVLDEIVDAMKRQNSTGKEKGMTTGLGYARAIGSTKFHTVQNMRDAKGNLAPDEQVKAYRKKTQDAFFPMVERISKGWPYPDTVGGQWDKLDAAGEAVGHYLRQGGTSEQAAHKALYKAGFSKAGEISDHGLHAFMDLAKSVGDAPVDYFEAKPQRGVKLNDFRAVVIPDSTPADVRAILEKSGVPVHEYPMGDDEARRKAVETAAKQADSPEDPVLFAVRKRSAEESSTVPKEPEKPEDQDTRPPATLFGQYDQSPTGIRNAKTDEMRKNLGLAEAAPVMRRSYGDVVMKEARDAFDANQNAGVELSKSLDPAQGGKARPITDTEDAILTMHQVDLQTQHAALVKTLVEAKGKGEDVQQLRLKEATLSDALLQHYNVTKAVGTANARGLAARRIMMNEDYSLASMETRARAARGGEALTAKEKEIITELHAKLKDANDRLEKYTKEAESKLRKAQSKKAVDGIIAEGKGAIASVGHTAKNFSSRREALLAGMRQKAASLTQGLGSQFAVRDEGPTSEQATPDESAGADWSKVPGIQKDLQELARLHVEDGVRDREKLLDLVHEDTKDIFQGMTRREKMDAISGYGDYRQLSKEDLDVQMRDLKGQMQQVGKLEDMQAGQAPSKTGVERRTPSDEERRLIQQVNETKKSLNIETTDPETQLKSALQARKTALTNQIKDLEYQIAKGEKTVKTKTPGPTDAELETMKTRRDGLQEEFYKIFGKPSLSDAQRLAAAVRSAEAAATEAERKVAEREIVPLKLGQKTSPELDAARARLAAANAELSGLRDLARGNEWDPGSPAEAKKLAALRAKIEALNTSLAGGKTGKTQGAPKPESPEVMAAKKQLELLHKTVADIQTPPKTREQIALAAFKTRTLNRMAELATKLATNDFAPKEAPKPVALDFQARMLQAQVERFKQAYEDGNTKARYAARTWGEKAQDYFTAWRRFALLSGETVIAKLSAAAMARVGITPLEEAIGGGLSKIPGLSTVAAKAHRQGGLNVAAEVASVTALVKRGMPEAWKQLKTGQSDLSAVYGPREKAHPTPTWMEFFGRLHGALKEPVKQAEWARSFEKRMAANAKAGVDVSDPIAQLRIGKEAYEDANRAIFMQDNVITDAYKRALSRFEEVDKETGKAKHKWIATAMKTVMPIVKVPTNIVGETLEYATGSVTGSVKLAKAYRAGIDKLSPAQADIIMRQLKKGSLGGAVLALGFFGAGSIGGFYQRGDKRTEDDAQVGEVKVFGVHVPKLVLHHPLLEALQMGATMRRVGDSFRKGKQEGTISGALAAALGLVEEVPFAREPVELAKLADPAQRDKVAADLASSVVVPQAISQPTKWLDPAPRNPQGFWENFGVAVPGVRQTVARGKAK